MTTEKVVTDEQLGRLARKEADLFIRATKGAVDLDRTLDGLQLLIEDKEVVSVESVRKAGGEVVLSKPKFIRDWEKFYRQIFGLTVDFSDVPIPKDPGGYTWPICVPPRSILGDEMALSGGKQQYKITRRYYPNMDTAIDHTFGRDALDESYIVRVRPFDEADEEMKNLSARTIQKQNINTLTFRERTLLQRFLLWKEKRILDKKTITLCAGSRFSVGDVPSSYWSGDGVDVDWCHLVNAVDNLRARRAVS